MQKSRMSTAVGLAACVAVVAPLTAIAQTTDDVGVTPAEFTGRWAFVDTLQQGTIDASDGRTIQAGGIWQYHVSEMSDPRMDGNVTISADLTAFDGTGTGIYNGAFRIENELGAWQELPTLTLEFANGTGSTRTSAMVGEGAYEGLSAVVEFAWDRPASAFDVRGVIIDGPPPLPPASLVLD